MKDIASLIALTKEERDSEIRLTLDSAFKAKVSIAKLMIAGEDAGDFEKGEGAKYILDLTTIDIRRDLQGTYEARNCFRAMLDGKIDVSEEWIAEAPDFGRVTLSAMLDKDQSYIDRAVAIIDSGEMVTKRLKDLRKLAKEGKPADGSATPPAVVSTEEKAEGDKPKASGESTDATPAPSGIQTAPTEEKPDPGDTHDVVLLDKQVCTLGNSDILTRMIGDIDGLESLEDATAMLGTLNQLKARLESQMEKLEAEASETKAPKEVAA